MATLKLEVGKYYKTRDGWKVGPMAASKGHDEHFVVDGLGLFTSDGVFGWVSGGVRNAPAPSWDLIAEWTDAPTGPVRTVTKREIVPGTYSGGVTVVSADDLIAGCRVSIATALGHADAGQLRAAIATLTEIAGALEEQA